jgi:hypothetical protein
MEFEDYDDAIESYENENYFDNDVEEPPEDLFLEETETNQKDDLDKNKGGPFKNCLL